MLGFRPLGDGALGALGQGITVAVPAATITLAGQAPAVAVGSGIAAPAANIAIEGHAPGLQTGVDVSIPLTGVTVQPQAPAIQTGAAVNVPATGVTITGLAPAIVRGVVVASPAANVNIVALAPTITAAVAEQAPEVGLPGGVGPVDTDAADRGRKRADDERKADRQRRKEAVERAFRALDPEQAIEIVEAEELPPETREAVAEIAILDLGGVAASLREMQALVDEIWRLRQQEIIEQIYEDEAIALLLLAA